MKPLGHRAYGSIAHLPGSRRGVGDHGLEAAQAALLTTKVRDRHDLVIVEEKLDGSCVSVANIDGSIVALGRAGYLASSSSYEQHHLWAAYVETHRSMFAVMLSKGLRLVGEWLALAHGTRYALTHGPFVAFDLMAGHVRATHDELNALCVGRLPRPKVLHIGNAPCSIDSAESALGDNGHHGAIDRAEGAVWRLERKGAVSFLGKYVRADKLDGVLLPELNDGISHWNWRPDGEVTK